MMMVLMVMLLMLLMVMMVMLMMVLTLATMMIIFRALCPEGVVLRGLDSLVSACIVVVAVPR